MDFGRVGQSRTCQTESDGADGAFLGKLLLHAEGMSLQVRGSRTGQTWSDGVEGGRGRSEPFDVFEPEEHSDCQTEGDQDYEGKGVGKSVEAYVDIHSVEAGYKRGDHEAY